jgi:hypothetical protein
MVGYFHKMAVPLSGWFFEGETSDWSNTQTITIEEVPTPSPETTPTPTPYNEPQSTEKELIFGVAVTVAVISVGLVLFFTLSKENNPQYCTSFWSVKKTLSRNLD